MIKSLYYHTKFWLASTDVLASTSSTLSMGVGERERRTTAADSTRQTTIIPILFLPPAPCFVVLFVQPRFFGDVIFNLMGGGEFLASATSESCW